MPAYRFRSEKVLSRAFKDLAISFNANPNTKDFGIVRNDNAIKQSVKNLMLTTFGERPFQPAIGSRIKGLLFEPFDVFLVEEMKTEIFNVIDRLEPRVTLTDVRIEGSEDTNSIAIELDYRITGQTVVQTVDFLLERA
jgi:phage baseplate assembly protein W|tara:strand:- start:152 stop:565 length:414 start_codon:yes stop_codon:yes gene_type:complete